MTEVPGKSLPGIGVFGTGPVTHLLIPYLKKIGYQISALWGCTLQEADSAASHLGIPYATNRIDDVLLRNDVNLVLILCPPTQHSTIAVRALGIGKHVSVQSPGGLCQEEALRMVQAAQYYPRLNATLNHGLRFLPAFTKMRSAIHSGYLGKTVSFCDVRISMGPIVGQQYSWLCDSTMGGGVLNLFGAHMIDLLYYLLGQKAVRVHGLTRTLAKTTDSINGIRQITSDDVVTFQLELDAGTVAAVTINSQLDGFQQDVILCGHEGHLAVRNCDLYGKKKDDDKETLLFSHSDSAEDEAGGFSLKDSMFSAPTLPAIYLMGLVHMFRELARSFIASSSSSSLELIGSHGEAGAASSNMSPPHASFSTFHEAQYVQAVMEAIRASSRDRKWAKVIVRADHSDTDACADLSCTSGYFFSQTHNIPAPQLYGT